MKKKLSINSNPLLRAYSYHAFLHAITSASGRVSNENESVSKIEIKDYNKSQWNIYNEELTYKNDNDYFDFFCNKWNQKMNITFIRDCLIEDTIEITIFNQLYANAYSNIKLFITNTSKDDFANSNDLNTIFYDNIVGLYSEDGVSFYKQNCYINPLISNYTFPVKMKMEKKDKKLRISYSDSNHQECFKDYELSDNYKHIGFSISLGDNKYYDWIFSNYINCYLDLKSDIIADFLGFPKKNYAFHSNNYFLYLTCIKESELDVKHTSIVDYIKEQINLNKYVEFQVNDNINYNIDDRKGVVFHQNLFYGYDDNQKSFYNLYYRRGNIYEGKFPYEAFSLIRNQMNLQRKIYSFNYSQNTEGLNLDINYLKRQYQEFISGENISNYEYRLENDNALYGISVFDFFKKEKNFNLLAKDIRISHFMYERSIINQNRIEYLLYKKCITNNDYLYLSEIIKTLSKKYLLIRNLLLKEKLSKKDYSESVISLLNDCYDLEFLFSKKIISIL